MKKYLYYPWTIICLLYVATISIVQIVHNILY